MTAVLYKRSAPPPPPPLDPEYLSPTSPPFGLPGIDTTCEYFPDERGVSTYISDDNNRRSPGFLIADDFDYNDDHDNTFSKKDMERQSNQYATAYISDDNNRHSPGFLIADDFDYNCDNETFSKEDMERQSNQYATAALDLYNSQENNMIKYKLIKAITSSAIMDPRGFYGHVNFTAKSSLEESKEEFFFAELCNDRNLLKYVPTCIVSLEEKESTGGVCGIKGNDGYRGMEIRIDTQYCYACHEELKHPEDGTLYETGHRVDDCYGYSCSS